MCRKNSYFAEFVSRTDKVFPQEKEKQFENSRVIDDGSTINHYYLIFCLSFAQLVPKTIAIDG